MAFPWPGVSEGLRGAEPSVWVTLEERRSLLSELADRNLLVSCPSISGTNAQRTTRSTAHVEPNEVRCKVCCMVCACCRRPVVFDALVFFSHSAGPELCLAGDREEAGGKGGREVLRSCDVVGGCSLPVSVAQRSVAFLLSWQSVSLGLVGVGALYKYVMRT